jgi:hypothetical protein
LVALLLTKPQEAPLLARFVFHSSQDRSIPAAAENDRLLLLEIDDCDCKDQDRAPANQQLFDVSIEHGTPPLERLPIRRSCHG